MSADEFSEAFLKSAICGMIDVARTNQGFEVSLPQAYASGNVVTVLVAALRDGFIVHDNSYAAMLLERSGSSKAAALADEMTAAIAHYGCELQNMRVTRRCATLDQVPLSAVLVGCASRLIADQAIKADALPLYDFKAELLGKVTAAVGVERVRTKYPVVGHLGSSYRVAAAVLDSAKADPLAFIEPISDAGAAARKFKEFYDLGLSETYKSIERVAVINEDSGLSSGDVLLMQEVSTLVRFSDAQGLFKQWANA